jgi:hypothetical protein
MQATQTHGARSIFGGIIVSSILGTEDRTDIEELARRLFLNRSLASTPATARSWERCRPSSRQSSGPRN